MYHNRKGSSHIKRSKRANPDLPSLVISEILQVSQKLFVSRWTFWRTKMGSLVGQFSQPGAPRQTFFSCYVPQMENGSIQGA